MSVKELLSNQGNLKTAIQVLLYEKYLSEFKVIDGINRRTDGMSFEEWLIDLFA